MACTKPFQVTVDCVDGEVRLFEGETELEGRLEVCFSRRWGTVGSEGWSQVNTKVVCNDLGYELDTGMHLLACYYINLLKQIGYSYSSRPLSNSMPVHLNNVRCSNKELTLLDCSYSRNNSSNYHSNDIGIRCKKSKLVAIIAKSEYIHSNT